MKPSERLRSRPRAAFDRRAMSRPWISTCPDVGVSRPPSTCSRVDLPEPEAPTTAMRSPGCTVRSTRSSTVSGSCTPGKVLRTPSQVSTAVVSVIAQRLRRLYTRCAPGRVQCRQEGQPESHGDDTDDIALVQIGAQLVDVVDVGRQQISMQYLLDHRHDVVDVERQ